MINRQDIEFKNHRDFLLIYSIYAQNEFILYFFFQSIVYQTALNCKD